MDVVLLAGGKGTRLGALTENLPKPLVEIAGKPIVLHQLDVARRYGCKRVLMLTGYMGERMEDYFGDGKRFGLEIKYVKEAVPLGTAGAVRAALAHLPEEFFLFYGDIIFDVDLARMAAFHAKHKAVATLAVHPNDHPYDSDLVEADAEGHVTGIIRKDAPRDVMRRNLVNAGLYCLSRAAVAEIPSEGAFDFGLDIFPRLVAKGKPLAAYRTPEYIKDAGTLDRLKKVENDIESGKVERSNLSRPRPAIFIDRDGVINEDQGEGAPPDALRLLPGVAEAIRKINHSEFMTVIVTNQPGVAKGFLSLGDVDQSFARLDHLLGEARAYVDDVFFCPHHPEKGFAGERPELKIVCDCRKPEPGLILTAASRYNIDLTRSYFIGDRTVDVEAGRRAGVMTVLVRTGDGGKDGKFAIQPDLVCDDLGAAVQAILVRPQG